MIGLSLFTLGSLAGGLAPNFSVLLTGRVLQGVGAAIASPAALALLTTEFAPGPERTRALAVYSGVQGAGGAVGVLLGGELTEYFSWRWVLFVNVPIGLVLIPATYLYLRESEPQPGRFDWFGALLSTGGMVALVYGFISAAKPGYGWRDPIPLTAFGLAVVLLTSFVILESRLPYAMMPLRILRNRNRSGAYIAMLSIGAGWPGCSSSSRSSSSSCSASVLPRGRWGSRPRCSTSVSRSVGPSGCRCWPRCSAPDCPTKPGTHPHHVAPRGHRRRTGRGIRPDLSEFRARIYPELASPGRPPADRAVWPDPSVPPIPPGARVR
jgi:MFS family permease